MRRCYNPAAKNIVLFYGQKGVHERDILCYTKEEKLLRQKIKVREELRENDIMILEGVIIVWI